MITCNQKISAFVLLSAAVLVFGAQPVEALNMSVYVRSISQVAFTAGVNLGHSVSASSNLNRVNASAAFEARCISSYTGQIIDQRGFGAQSLLGGTSLTVTVPASWPAQRNMPGFDQVPGGTTLSCSYNWTADAEEATYTIGANGVGFTIGGEKNHDGTSVPFEMYKPGASGTDDNNGCIR